MNPRSQVHVFHSRFGAHLFLVDGGHIRGVPEAEAERVAAWLEEGGEPEPELGALARDLERALLGGEDGGATRHSAAADLPEAPPLNSLSLNVSLTCNLACGYCRSDFGRFGGRARLMSLDVAQAAVDRLLAEAEKDEEGGDLLLGFVGGEPLLNREVIHETTRYAAGAARRAGRVLRFVIATNGTVIQRRDVELFAEFPFTVTLGLDGERDLHDRLRPTKRGAGSYEGVLRALELFEQHGRPRHLAARVTVTPGGGELSAILDHVLGLGFDEARLDPVLVSPEAELSFGREDFEPFLEQMIACGEKALEELAAGRAYPFANFEAAMNQIHRRAHRPHPCAAGASYLAVGAEGGLYACHRLAEDPRFALGDLSHGRDRGAQIDLLRRNHVDRVEPCRDCWARYLCGGGCYEEVMRRGRPGCDYIRGWLSFCLRAYTELRQRRPEYFFQNLRRGVDRVSRPADAIL